MTINYNISGKVQLKIQDYAEKMLEYLPEDINREASTNPKTFSTIRRITHDFWTEEKQPEEFNYGRLGILL